MAVGGGGRHGRRVCMVVRCRRVLLLVLVVGLRRQEICKNAKLEGLLYWGRKKGFQWVW